jgi:hypothetical protein
MNTHEYGFHVRFGGKDYPIQCEKIAHEESHETILL